MRTKLLTGVVALAALSNVCTAQVQGRVFLPVADTIAIYEFNGIANEALPNGTCGTDPSPDLLGLCVFPACE